MTKNQQDPIHLFLVISVGYQIRSINTNEPYTNMIKSHICIRYYTVNVRRTSPTRAALLRLCAFASKCTARCCREWTRHRTCSSAARWRTPPSGRGRCSCTRPGKPARLHMGVFVILCHVWHRSRAHNLTHLDNRRRCSISRPPGVRESGWWTATVLLCATWLYTPKNVDNY